MLLVLLAKGIRQGFLTNGEAMTLTGKLDHYANIVNGRYERCLIMHMVEDQEVKARKQARTAMVRLLLNKLAADVLNQIPGYSSS